MTYSITPELLSNQLIQNIYNCIYTGCLDKEVIISIKDEVKKVMQQNITEGFMLYGLLSALEYDTESIDSRFKSGLQYINNGRIHPFDFYSNFYNAYQFVGSLDKAQKMLQHTIKVADHADFFHLDFITSAFLNFGMLTEILEYEMKVKKLLVNEPQKIKDFTLFINAVKKTNEIIGSDTFKNLTFKMLNFLNEKKLISLESGLIIEQLDGDYWIFVDNRVTEKNTDLLTQYQAEFDLLQSTYEIENNLNLPISFSIYSIKNN